MKNTRLKLLSVSQLLPTTVHPEVGIFVQRRLLAMAQQADVEIVQPISWFPFLRPFRADGMPELEDGSRADVLRRPMFYLPRIMKRWDAGWLEKCVTPVLRQRLAQGSLDAVDAHFGYPTGVGCYRAASKLGIPVFITIRGVESVQLRSPGIGPQLVAALNQCAGVVAVSQGLKDAVVGAGVAPDQVCVIPNAVDTNRYTPGDKATARRQLGLPQGAPIVVAVGNLVSLKRHHILLTAFAALRRTRPEARLVIVGGRQYESTYPRQLLRQISVLDLGQAVTMTGAVPPRDVPTWLTAADVFSLVSCREGSCNAVLEAMACGLPVVVTPVGENEHHVVDGRNGFLVPVDDAVALTNALDKTLDCQWDRDELAARVRNYAWHNVAECVLDYMRSRLSGREVTRTSACFGDACSPVPNLS